MNRTIYVTVHESICQYDGDLGDYLFDGSDPGQTRSQTFDVPAEWIRGDKFADERKMDILRLLYGESWFNPDPFANPVKPMPRVLTVRVLLENGELGEETVFSPV